MKATVTVTFILVLFKGRVGNFFPETFLYIYIYTG